MRRILLLSLAAILVSTAATADHIGIYSDATASSCVLSAGVNNTVTLVHKFASGTTGSRFRVDVASAPGSALYSFSTSFITAGTLSDDFSVSYGPCLSGAFAVATVVSLLTPGQIYIRPALGKSNVVYTNCSFVDVIASGGQASIGDSSCMASGVEAATWGQIKSLYR